MGMEGMRFIFDFDEPSTPRLVTGTSLGASARSPDDHGPDQPSSGRCLFNGNGAGVQRCDLTTVHDNESEDEVTQEEQILLAQERIQELEARLDNRERELRLLQDRLKKQLNQGRRLRRRARSGDRDLFGRNYVHSVEDDADVVSPDEPLGEYILITVSGFLSKSEESYSEDDGERRSLGVPLYLRRLEGQMFAVGPKGASIGAGANRGIWLPEETEVSDHNGSIRWHPKTRVDSEGYFELHPGQTEDSSVLILNSNSENVLLSDEQQYVKLTSPKKLENQMKFVTGMVIWTVSPMPRRRMIISRMFDAIRNQDLITLKSLFELASQWNKHVRRVHQGKPNISTFFINSNTEEDREYILIDEDSLKVPKVSDSNILDYADARKNQFTIDSNQKGKFCLLHVAVDYCSKPIVSYLLENGAKVNKLCGSMKLSPLHIAVRHSHIEIIKELLKHGADLEVTDSHHLLPVSLAETYAVRKLLLFALMLCAAADGGDLEEAKRLMANGVSPNAKALSQKAPLHLAAINGHEEVVEYLLQNGASVNMTGGKSQRTALHYASLGNHVNVAKILLAHGANEEIVDSLGYSALNLSNGGEMCRLLHKESLSLCLATQAGDIDEVRHILESSSSPARKTSAEVGVKQVSRTPSGRKISRQVAMSNLGLCLAVDQRNEQGHAPLHLASTAGNLDLVRLLVSYGATIDLPGGLDKWTPLFYASLAGHAEVVGFLLAIGADPDRLDAQGLTCIDHVEKNIDNLKEKMEQGKIKQMSFENETAEESLSGVSAQLLVPPQLHRQRSDSNLSNKGQRSWMKKQIARLEHVLNVLQSGQQKLLNALEQRNLKLLGEVLEIGDVSINGPLTKHTQTTALSYAATAGMPEFVELLLQYEADPLQTDGQSFTPMHLAAKYGHEDVVQVLLNSKVDPNIQTITQKLTPLHVAALHSREEVVEVLLKEGADASLCDHEGMTPFDVSQELQIQELLASGHNRLYVSVAKGDLDMVKKLIEKDRIHINVLFTHGNTPLHIACENEHADIADYLLQKGADVNRYGGPNLSTPLHLAVQGSSTLLAEMLIQHGAKLSAADCDGKTPFEVAKSNDMRKVLVNARTLQVTLANSVHTGGTDSESEDDGTQANRCRICFDNVINTIILPCGHQAFCKDCAAKLEICAFDRRPISQVVPVFIVGSGS